MLYLYLGVVVRGAAEAAIFKKKRRVKLAVILMIIDKYIIERDGDEVGPFCLRRFGDHTPTHYHIQLYL